MNSSLATARYPAHTNNYYGTRGVAIDKIIVHHMAGVSTAKSCAVSFQNPNRGGSSNYCIGNDGEIAVSVDEMYASGASSSKQADLSGVTIETSNSKYGDAYGWPVSDKALKSLISLCADIAKRNNLGILVPGKNLCWHSMYGATQCPGPYLLGKMQYIADEANAINTPLKENEHKLDGIDIQRKTNYLVFYTKGESSNANKYGIEARVIDNKVTGIEKGVGKMKRNGGWVLSGHGTAATWMDKTIHVGDKVTRYGNKVIVERAKNTIGKNEYKVNGTNIKRTADTLIVYKDVASTGTNKYGIEIRVRNGKAVLMDKYKNGNMKLEGGCVISGHGKAAEWLAKNVKIGDKIEIYSNKITIAK